MTSKTGNKQKHQKLSAKQHFKSYNEIEYNQFQDRFQQVLVFRIFFTNLNKIKIN